MDNLKSDKNMTQTIFHSAFAPIKKFAPRWLSNIARSTATAFLTPLVFAHRSGHFLSSFKMAAVSRNGAPLPWFSYPCTEFLKHRNYESRTVLEFGGGQSTLWWAKRAGKVVTLEGDRRWHDRIAGRMPANVDLHLVSMESREKNVTEVEEVLASLGIETYDVIVIDGLCRHEMIDIACGRLGKDGIIICDDAEGYDFHGGFLDRGMLRVDFYGHVPGVIMPHCTAVYFKPDCFAFDAKTPICPAWNEG